MMDNLATLVTQFYKHCENRNLSPETVRWYQSFLTRFTQTFTELPLKTDDIETFIGSYISGDERRHGAWRALRSFYGFVSKSHDLQNPMNKINPPRRRAKEKPCLTLEQLRKLLTCPEHPQYMKALLTLLVDTGMRIGEAACIKKADIGENTINISGKTGERIVPISEVTRDMLLSLPGEKCFPYSDSFLRHETKKAFSQAGVVGSAHTLRHSFASLFDGSDLALKNILGHSSFQMVEHYQHRKTARAIEEHTKHNLLDKIGLNIPVKETLPPANKVTCPGNHTITLNDSMPDSWLEEPELRTERYKLLFHWNSLLSNICDELSTLFGRFADEGQLINMNTVYVVEELGYGGYGNVSGDEKMELIKKIAGEFWEYMSRFAKAESAKRYIQAIQCQDEADLDVNVYNPAIVTLGNLAPAVYKA